MFYRFSTVLVATLLAVSSSTWALGINCQGSSKCNGAPKDTLQQIYNLIENQIDPNFFFPDGRQIACSSSICAFLQKSQGASGSLIRTILDDLKNHNCKVCGSVPTLFRNGTNDINFGELTLNFVSQPCGDASAPCLGLLPQFE